MPIEIRGLSVDRALRSHVTTRLTGALRRMGMTRVPAVVTFFDENGPKGGPAIRCAFTVQVPYRPHLRAEDTAETSRTAFDGGFAKLERELERYRDRDRESKRRPKKYFTAKRLLSGPPEGAGAKAKRRRPAK